MKKLIVLFIIMFLISCKNTSSTKDVTNDTLVLNSTLDTILMHSSKNFELTNQINKQSDSLVTHKVEKTAEKITHLETQVTELKKENDELKVKLDDVINDDGKPYVGLPVSPN